MKLIPLYQGRSALVDDDDYERLLGFKWIYTGGYVNRKPYCPSVNGVRKYRNVSLHREIMNPPDGMVVDHIDGNVFNNQKTNLRICTHRENIMNQRTQIRVKASKYKGVYRDKRRNTWNARIKVNQKTIHIGVFLNEDDAARAYNIAAITHFGEFARLNAA